MLRRIFAVSALLLLLTAVSGVQARSRHSRSARVATFDYYLLALSYAPDFCDQGNNPNSPECGTGRHTAFVVHGLWPQGESSRGPERCGGASPVSQDLIRVMLGYYPTASLIQHEWSAHGTCTDLSPQDYFASVRQARDSVKIPATLAAPARSLQLDPHAIEAQFAAANPAFPAQAFRVSCYPNAELQEARVCFDKQLHPRACSPSAGACSAAVATVLPVR